MQWIVDLSFTLYFWNWFWCLLITLVRLRISPLFYFHFSLTTLRKVEKYYSSSWNHFTPPCIGMLWFFSISTHWNLANCIWKDQFPVSCNKLKIFLHFFSIFLVVMLTQQLWPSTLLHWWKRTSLWKNSRISVLTS